MNYTDIVFLCILGFLVIMAIWSVLFPRVSFFILRSDFFEKQLSNIWLFGLTFYPVAILSLGLVLRVFIKEPGISFFSFKLHPIFFISIFWLVFWLVKMFLESAYIFTLLGGYATVSHLKRALYYQFRWFLVTMVFLLVYHFALFEPTFILYAYLGISLLIFIWQWVAHFKSEVLQGKLPWFGFILYLCALEILPIIVAILWLNKF